MLVLQSNTENYLSMLNPKLEKFFVSCNQIIFKIL